jgi:ACS family glucarate transporter-like MFS transporter
LLEIAADQLGETMRNYRRIWICAFLFTLTAINYADRVALSVAATPVAQEFGLSKVEMGYLLSSFLWAYVLCLIPVGLLVDRFGGKIVNACGIGLWSLATVCTGLAPSYWFVIVSRVVMGMGESTCWPASNRIIREWFPAAERAFANAIFGAGAAAGPAVGALGISAIVGAWGWRWGFIVAGAIGFVWLLLWWIFFDHPERARWLHPAERDTILRERDGEFAVHIAEQPSSSLWYLLSLRSTWGLFLTQGCEVYGGYMLLTWLPTYLHQAKGLSVMDSGMLTAIPFGVAAVLGIALGRLSDLLLNPGSVSDGKRRIMIAVLLAGASSLMIIPLINQLWLIIGLLAVMRAMGMAGSALNFALVTDLVRNRSDIGKVTSTTVVGGNTFGLCAPIVTGYVVQITGSFDNAFYIAGFLPLIGAVATLTMTRRAILPARLATAASA